MKTALHIFALSALLVGGLYVANPALASEGSSHSLPSRTKGERIFNNFKALDANNDGGLSYEEYSNAMPYGGGGFSDLDINGDGAISHSELKVYHDRAVSDRAEERARRVAGAPKNDSF